MKKRITAFLAAMAMLPLSACSASPARESSAPGSAEPASEASAPAPETAETLPGEEKDPYYPVTVTSYNYAGEEITLTFGKAPERVLAVYQGSIETMIALGLEDRVAASYGLDNEVKEEWRDGFSRMSYSDTSFAPDKETAVMLEPDLIFSWGSLLSGDMLGDADYWIKNGTNTYINTNTRTGGSRVLENEYADILNLGIIFNVQEKAEALVNRMKADVETAREAAEAEESAPVVAIIGFYDSGIRNFGLELAGDIAEHLGVEVMRSAERYLGKEDLLAADPDVIFVEYMPRPGEGGDAVREEELSKLLEDPSLASMRAIREGRVYTIMLGEIYAPAVRTGDGIRTLAAGIFPGLFD